LVRRHGAILSRRTTATTVTIRATTVKKHRGLPYVLHKNRGLYRILPEKIKKIFIFLKIDVIDVIDVISE
jgi:hypothetical protein